MHTNKKREINKNITIYFVSICGVFFLFSSPFCIVFISNHSCWLLLGCCCCCCCCCSPYSHNRFGSISFRYVCFYHFTVLSFILGVIVRAYISNNFIVIVSMCVYVCFDALGFSYSGYTFSLLFCVSSSALWRWWSGLRAAAAAAFFLKSLQRAFSTNSVSPLFFHPLSIFLSFFDSVLFCFCFVEWAKRDEVECLNILLFVFIVTIVVVVVGCYFVNTDILMYMLCTHFVIAVSTVVKVSAHFFFLLSQIVICLCLRQHYLLYDCYAVLLLHLSLFAFLHLWRFVLPFNRLLYFACMYYLWETDTQMNAALQFYCVFFIYSFVFIADKKRRVSEITATAAY